MRLSSHNYPCLYALHQAPAFFVIRSKSNFEKMPLYQAFAQNVYKKEITAIDNQLKLFDS